MPRSVSRLRCGEFNADSGGLDAIREEARIGAMRRPMASRQRCAIAFASAAARCMLDDISPVTVLCSSTAAAVAVTYSLTPWIASLMLSSADTTSPEMPLRFSISCPILSVEIGRAHAELQSHHDLVC